MADRAPWRLRVETVGPQSLRTQPGLLSTVLSSQDRETGGRGNRPPSLVLGLLPEQTPLLSQPHLPLRPQPCGLDDFCCLPAQTTRLLLPPRAIPGLTSSPSPSGLVPPCPATDLSTRLPLPSPRAAKHQRKPWPCKASHCTSRAQARGAPNFSASLLLHFLSARCPPSTHERPPSHLQVQHLPSARDLVPVATPALSSRVHH